MTERLRSARRSGGVSLKTLADRAGITAAHYQDLEEYRDDIFSTVSVRQAILIANELNIELAELISEANVQYENSEENLEALTARDLKNINVGDASDFSGIENEFLREARDDPRKVLDLNFELLIALCAYLQKDPTELLENMTGREMRPAKEDRP
jgi:transcriptional regulator with XRE-family HTH domain